MQNMIVRAMLHVSSINQSGWQQNGEAKAGDTIAHFSCVYSAKPGTEKHKFWKASPSGKAEIRINDGPDFKPGECYYFDFERIEDDAKPAPDVFLLNELTLQGEKGKAEPSRITAKWFASHYNSRIEISIDNENVFGFHELGGLYRVTITPVD